MAEKYVFGPFPHRAGDGLQRADLEFYGIDVFRPSFTVRVFFNDPDVELGTASEERPSYAGSFSIFGHARCSGDTGHCDLHAQERRFDDRRSHPLTRAFKRVIVTEAVRRAASAGEALSVTLLVAGPDDGADQEGSKKGGKKAKKKNNAHHYTRLLDFRGLQLTTFD